MKVIIIKIINRLQVLGGRREVEVKNEQIHHISERCQIHLCQSLNDLDSSLNKSQSPHSG